MYSENFEKIVGHHIEIEGGLVNHPNDPGGLTKYGISQRFNPDIDVANLTVDQAKAYYYDRYWSAMKLDLVDDYEVAAEMFDQGAGPQGPGTAVMIAQGALILLGVQVALDGGMGPQTAGALNNYPHKQDLVKLMNCLQFLHFLIGNRKVDEIIAMVKPRMKILNTFIRGWVRNRITL